LASVCSTEPAVLVAIGATPMDRVAFSSIPGGGSHSANSLESPRPGARAFVAGKSCLHCNFKWRASNQWSMVHTVPESVFSPVLVGRVSLLMFGGREGGLAWPLLQGPIIRGVALAKIGIHTK